MFLKIYFFSKKSVKILLKFFLTLLYIPYMLIAALLPLYSLILPNKITEKIAVYLAYLGWSLSNLNLRLSCNFKITDDKLNNSYILISNHIGSLDFMIIHELAIKNEMLKKMKYLIKKEAFYIPIFGYLMKKINFLFLQRNFQKDSQNIKKYCLDLKINKEPVWLVVYPEGTRFTKKKQIECKIFSEKNDLPVFKNVLNPKSKGCKLIVDSLKNSHVKEVLDVTMYYEGEVPSLWYFMLFVTDANVIIDTRRINLEEIEDFDIFLAEVFKRKDELIEQWKCNF